jgi:hypothetical protein
VIVRWDDVQPGEDIGRAADALNVSLHRLELAPEETAKQSDATVEELVFVCYYPRSNKIYWRGVGLITRLEPLGYDDGEPEE